MASIDIRGLQGEQITRINFSDGDNERSAVAIEIGRHDISFGTVGIVHLEEDSYTPATLHSKADAENLIAALKKAIELGWLK